VIGVAIQPKDMPDNKAAGLALTWRTPNHALAPSYQVYRGESADFPLDKQHLMETVVKRSAQDCSFETDGAYFYRVVALGAGGSGKPSDATSAAAKANQVRTPELADASWARIEGENIPTRKMANKRPVIMQGKTFEKGIGMQGNTTIHMNIARMVETRKDYRFRATVGMDDSTPDRVRKVAAARFIVELDGKKAFDSGRMKWADGTKDIDIAVPAGTKKSTLIVKREGERGSDNASWGNPHLERTAP